MSHLKDNQNKWDWGKGSEQRSRGGVLYQTENYQEDELIMLDTMSWVPFPAEQQERKEGRKDRRGTRRRRKTTKVATCCF